MKIIERKLLSARFHIGVNLAGVNGTSVTKGKETCKDLTLTEIGVVVKTNIGEVFMPFSNVIGCVLEPEAKSKGPKDA